MIKTIFIILASFICLAAASPSHADVEENTEILSGEQHSAFFEVVDRLAFMATQYLLEEKETGKKMAGESLASNTRLSAVYHDGLGGFGLAVSNHQINDFIPMGLELEVQASPLSGSGAIMFKKSF